MASGANVKAVQRMLGHASAAMTLDRYGHLLGDELDAVAERVSAARAQWQRNRPAVCVRSEDDPDDDEEDGQGAD